MDGVVLWQGLLDAAAQGALVSEVFRLARAAPFYRPRMPGSGKLFSVEETNFGVLGWISDEAGYRYAARHPYTDKAWPAMPRALLELWDRASGYPAPPVTQPQPQAQPHPQAQPQPVSPGLHVPPAPVPAALWHPQFGDVNPS